MSAHSTLLPRRRYLLWLPFIILLAAVIGAIAWRGRQPKPQSLPQDADSLVATAEPLGWHVCRVSDHACYLTVAERTASELSAMPDKIGRDEEWAGVIYCERTQMIEQPPKGTIVAGWWLYGDPAMIARLRAQFGPYLSK